MPFNRSFYPKWLTFLCVGGPGNRTHKPGVASAMLYQLNLNTSLPIVKTTAARPVFRQNSHPCTGSKQQQVGYPCSADLVFSLVAMQWRRGCIAHCLGMLTTLLSDGFVLHTLLYLTVLRLKMQCIQYSSSRLLRTISPTLVTVKVSVRVRIT